MKAIKDFEYFIGEGVVKKQKPDKSRAEFLIREAEQGRDYLHKLIEKMHVDDRNANNYVKECYDILMELIRAKMLLNGLNASGFGAHEAEVSYTRTIGFSEAEVQSLDQMRFFRNGMLYYGVIIDKEYAKKVIGFFDKIYPRLMRLIK